MIALCPVGCHNAKNNPCDNLQDIGLHEAGLLNGSREGHQRENSYVVFIRVFSLALLEVHQA